MRARLILVVSLLVLQLGTWRGAVRAQDAAANGGREGSEGTESSAQTSQHVAEREHAAKLTPIVVSPHDTRKTAFQLYVEIDIPVLVTSAILASARILRTEEPRCRMLGDHCDPSELNGFDRHFAGTWRPTWATYSDIALFGLMGGAGSFLLVDEGVWPALNDVVVVAESAFVATALPSMTTLATSRPRPYAYGSRAPLGQRRSGAAALSFISSHTSVSFAIATSMFFAAKRLHPESALCWVVLGAGVAIAGSVATARVIAGQHFPTDAIAGAAIGASVGTVVSAVHRSPLEVTPTPGGAQLSYMQTF